MIVKKCDICGAEMRITTPRYKVTFDGWLYTEEIDICMDCFERIAEEIKQADTPQTDCNANQCAQRVEYIGDIEKKRCRTCKHFESEFHTPISSDGTYYPYVICTAKECHYESVDTPQTDCAWK